MSDLPSVQRYCGHKILSMVARYAHQNGARIAAAMDKLEVVYRREASEMNNVTPIREVV